MASVVELPIFPLSDVVLFPQLHVPLHIFEQRYRQMTEAALAGDRRIGMVAVLPAQIASTHDDPWRLFGSGAPKPSKMAALARRYIQHRSIQYQKISHQVRTDSHSSASPSNRRGRTTRGSAGSRRRPEFALAARREQLCHCSALRARRTPMPRERQIRAPCTD